MKNLKNSVQEEEKGEGKERGRCPVPILNAPQCSKTASFLTEIFNLPHHKTFKMLYRLGCKIGHSRYSDLTMVSAKKIQVIVQIMMETSKSNYPERNCGNCMQNDNGMANAVISHSGTVGGGKYSKAVLQSAKIQKE